MRSNWPGSTKERFRGVEVQIGYKLRRFIFSRLAQVLPDVKLTHSCTEGDHQPMLVNVVQGMQTPKGSIPSLVRFQSKDVFGRTNTHARDLLLNVLC